MDKDQKHGVRKSVVALLMAACVGIGMILPGTVSADTGGSMPASSRAAPSSAVSSQSADSAPVSSANAQPSSIVTPSAVTGSPRDVGDGGASAAKAQLAAGKEPVYDSPDDAYATPGTITLGSSFDPAKSPLIAWHDTDQTPEQAPLAVKLVACSPAWNINKAGKYDLTYEVSEKEGQAQPVLVHSSATVKPFAPLAANNLRAATPRASYKFTGTVKSSTSHSGADGFRGSTFRISAAGSGPLQTTINSSTWYCGNHDATTPQVGAGGNVHLIVSCVNVSMDWMSVCTSADTPAHTMSLPGSAYPAWPVMVILCWAQRISIKLHHSLGIKAHALSLSHKKHPALPPSALASPLLPNLSKTST